MSSAEIKITTAADLVNMIKGPKGLHDQSLEARKVGNYKLALDINAAAIRLFDEHAKLPDVDPFLRYFLFAAKGVYLLEDSRPEEALTPFMVAYVFAKTVKGEKASRKEMSLCLYHIGRCLGEGSHPIEGLSYIQEAMELTDNPLEKHRRKIRVGELFMKAGEGQKAVGILKETTEDLTQFFKEIVQLDPKSSDFDSLYEKMDKETLISKIMGEIMVVYNRLTGALLSVGNAAEALETMRKSIGVTKCLTTKLDPTQNNQKLRKHYSEAQDLLGQHEVSFEEFFASIPPA